MTASLDPGTVAVGDTVSRTVVEGLTRTQIVQYAGASGDLNPLHTDEPYAAAAGGLIGHGMLTMAMTGTLLTALSERSTVVRFGARFRAPVRPGDTLTATGTVDALRRDGGAVLVDLALTTRNGEGEPVLTGYATVRIPDDHAPDDQEA